MDKDRIAGSAKQVKDDIKQTAGKGICDAKPETDDKADIELPGPQGAQGDDCATGTTVTRGDTRRQDTAVIEDPAGEDTTIVKP